MRAAVIEELKLESVQPVVRFLEVHVLGFRLEEADSKTSPASGMGCSGVSRLAVRDAIMGDSAG